MPIGQRMEIEMDNGESKVENEQDGTSTTSGQHHRACGHARRCGRPWWAKLLFVLAIVGVVFALRAWTHEGHGWYGGSPFAHGTADPAVMARRVERVTDRMLDKVDATAIQRQKVMTISRAMVADLQPLIEAHRAARASLYSALTAEMVDPTRLEQLRSETLQRFDAVSRRITRAAGEVATVLTPAQRRELLARLQGV